MALISCPECGKEFSDRAVSCPNCGFPVSEMESDQEETLLNEIYENHKINAFSAIKEYMERTGCGYVEAQKAVSDFYNAKAGEGIPQREKKEKAKKEYSHGLKCPKCKSHNIDLWSNEANMKEFQRTGLNLNPLHPLTLFKTKTIKKEKTSAAKVGLAMVTGGTSALLVGTKSKKHNEYYCRDCGKRWIGK